MGSTLEKRILRDLNRLHKCHLKELYQPISFPGPHIIKAERLLVKNRELLHEAMPMNDTIEGWHRTKLKPSEELNPDFLKYL